MRGYRSLVGWRERHTSEPLRLPIRRRHQAGYGRFSSLHLGDVDADENGLGVEADYTTGDITIDSSSMSRNTGSGFAASSASHIEMTETMLMNNGRSGIRTTVTSGVTMDRVRIEGNAGSGVSVGGHGGMYDIRDATILHPKHAKE